MNLDDAQRKKVTEWIEQGLKLSEIQNKLASEFGLTLTYMDVRFLIDDLKLKVKDTEPPKPPAPVVAAPGVPANSPAAGQAEAAPLTPMPEGGVSGGVSVSVDHVARPGAIVSGKVTFSDGKSAEWHLDQHGRLGLAAKEQGYRPSQQDVADFQAQLQQQLAKMGY